MGHHSPFLELRLKFPISSLFWACLQGNMLKMQHLSHSKNFPCCNPKWSSDRIQNPCLKSQALRHNNPCCYINTSTTPTKASFAIVSGTPCLRCQQPDITLPSSLAHSTLFLQCVRWLRQLPSFQNLPPERFGAVPPRPISTLFWNTNYPAEFHSKISEKWQSPPTVHSPSEVAGTQGGHPSLKRKRAGSGVPAPTLPPDFVAGHAHCFLKGKSSKDPCHLLTCNGV